MKFCLPFFSAEDLCELLPGSHSRPPRFYRVSQKDESVFPPFTFSSLSLTQILIEEESLRVFWSVKLDYYYTDYDWGLIFRQIGVDDHSQGAENMFFKTRYNLKTHLEANSDWTPKSENLTAMIGGLQSNHYYEVCIAVVEHVTVYYIHRDLCKEIRIVDNKAENNKQELSDEDSQLSQLGRPIARTSSAPNKNIIATKNVTIVPSYNSITLTWKIEIENNSTITSLLDQHQPLSSMISVIRQISVRKFGSENATQLFVLEDFNKTALMTGGNIESEAAR